MAIKKEVSFVFSLHINLHLWLQSFHRYFAAVYLYYCRNHIDIFLLCSSLFASSKLTVKELIYLQGSGARQRSRCWSTFVQLFPKIVLKENAERFVYNYSLILRYAYIYNSRFCPLLHPPFSRPPIACHSVISYRLYDIEWIVSDITYLLIYIQTHSQAQPLYNISMLFESQSLISFIYKKNCSEYNINK